MVESSNFEPKKKLRSESKILGDGIAQLTFRYWSEDSFFPTYCKQAVQCTDVVANIVYKPKKIEFVGISGQVEDIFYDSIDNFRADKMMPGSMVVYPEYLIKGNPPQIDIYKDCNTGLDLDLIVVRLKEVANRTTKTSVYEKLNLYGLIEYISRANKLRDAIRKDSILKDIRDRYHQKFGRQ